MQDALKRCDNYLRQKKVNHLLIYFAKKMLIMEEKQKFTCEKSVFNFDKWWQQFSCDSGAKTIVVNLIIIDCNYRYNFALLKIWVNWHKSYVKMHQGWDI